MKFWSSGDGMGSRVEKKLKTIDLSNRKIEEKKAGFGGTRDVLSKRKIFIKDDTKVTSRINRCESDIVWKMNSRSLGELNLESCCGRPMTRNSVLEGLSVRTFVDIQLETFETAVSRKVMV